MVAAGYQVLGADVLRRTTRIAVIRPHEGKRAGEEITVPITVFEVAEEVEMSDDECVLAEWWLRKEGLLVEESV